MICNWGGGIWTLPITLEVNHDYTLGSTQDLYYNDKLVGKIDIEDKFRIHDEDLFELFQTKDLNHPGIRKEKSKSALKIGGRIEIKEQLLKHSLYKGILAHVFKKEIRSIVGFQTRNAIHRAHEYLQKIGLELCDALFINPLIGWKKEGDFTQEALMRSYEIMLNGFYPSSRVFIRGLETNMRYAGPREAIFHALLRKNMGCTHFIIGRDHAGVGNYYGIYDAHKLARQMKERLGIKLLLLKEPYFCTKCEQIVSSNVCSHEHSHKLSISGTKIRQALSLGKIPDERLMRKEVAYALMELGIENIFIRS